MSETFERIASLSVEQRRALELLLKKKERGQKQTIRRRPESEAAPLSYAQQRMWFLDQLEPGSSFYNIPAALHLAGPFDVEALRRALSEIVSRHESLRTTFQVVDGQVMQVIAAPAPLELPVVDLRGLPEAERRQQVRALTHASAHKPFDLARGPLLRVEVIREEEQSHVALLTMHHIVSDGWSMGVLIKEVAALYEAYARGVESPLAELPIQYADYSVWQREWLQGEVLEKQLDYWREQLAGAPAVLELPTDRPRPVVPSFRGARATFKLSADLSDKLGELSRHEGATLFMTLLAAFQTLLHRYTRQTDIVVGTDIANRNREEIEGLIGFFVNMLVLRGDLAADPSFRALLGRVKQTALGAYAHQDIPFEKVVEELQPERHLSRSPLFQVVFVLQNVPMPELELAGLRLTQMPVEREKSQFDLVLSMNQTPDGLTGMMEYCDLFDAATIERMLEHFQTLLAGIVADPDARLSRLPLLTAPERERLLVGWNDTRSPRPEAACIHELFAAQAERTPDATALIFDGTETSYRELNERANRLAHYLRAVGVGPETRVGLCAERSAEMVVGLLGILKAGGAYVPLDPNYPLERLAFMMEDAAIPVLLTQEHLLEHLPMHWAQVVCLDADWESVAAESSENPSTDTRPENLAYVIYTSGSAGRPKGVMVTHGSLVNHALAAAEAFALAPGDRVLQFISVSFDAFGEELYPALCGGAALVLHRNPTEDAPARLAQECERAGVTMLHLTAAYWHQLVDDLAATGRRVPASLRLLVVGGEHPSVARLSTWRQLSRQPTRFINAYGPTEATITSTMYEAADAPGELAAARLPIGRPVANAQVYLLDASMQPVPAGVPGELFVGGLGVARGYLNRADLTAERFVPDSFSAEPGARLYRTGDLARYRADGQLEFLGRADNQVKVRGYRIELGEIEAALAEHPVVADTMVLARETEGGDKRLVAYVVSNKSHVLPGVQLHRLPNDMEVACVNQREADLIYDEIFEARTYLKHGVTLNDGDCVFDVGANIGLFTLFAHQACRGPRVYAFEPLPPLFEKLQANAALYGLSVELFDCGLSDESRSTAFTYYPQMTAMSGAYADTAADEQTARAFIANQGQGLTAHTDELLAGRFESQTFQCQLRTISDVIREHEIERIDLLKIDVEKSELDVLNGIAADDWRKIKQLVLEVHDVGGRLARIKTQLAERGFEFVVEQEELLKHTSLYNIYAVRETADAPPADGRRGPSAEHKLEPQIAAGVSFVELRDHLKGRVPEYMIPSAFVILDELPLTPNGKVDRAALQQLEQTPRARQESFVAPRTEAETLLARIWCDVLGRDSVGVHDNFFALGGDSILSIQIVARAAQAGLRLSTRQLFQQQTVAELAAVAEPALRREPEQEVSGEVVLTPIQRWFFEHLPEAPHHYNQSVLLEVPAGAEAWLGEAVEAVARRHDALRLRFSRVTTAEAEASGGACLWRQEYAADSADAVGYEEVDLSGLDGDERRRALEEAAQAAQESLDLSGGPVACFVLFKYGAGERGRLLAVAHHLVVDGVSWRVLLGDLEAAAGQLERGEALCLPARTSSYQRWASRLAEYAQTSEVREQLPYWLEQARRPDALLPVDDPEGDNTLASAASVTVRLSAEETRALLQDVPAVYGTQINDALLAALAEALAAWTGQANVSWLVDLEAHGREDIFEEIDLSRTVGWFTSFFPLPLAAARPAPAPGETLKRVKELLRGVPQRGLGYMLLRYLNTDPEVAARFRELPDAQISFNYLGQFDQALAGSTLFTSAAESKGGNYSASLKRSHLLAVNGAVSGGSLAMSFDYSAAVFTRAAMEDVGERYAAALRGLIAEARAARRREYTPSDFPLARLDGQQLDRLLADAGEVEDLYPLTPMQQGMLFHSLYAPDAGEYFEQMNCRLEADLNLHAFEQAWREVLQRQPILRTSFRWEGLNAPLQLVWPSAPLAVDQQDWRGLPADEQERRLAAYLLADRARPFDLKRAPLLRLALCRLDDNSYQLIWSFHHLLLDGWSTPLLLKEVFALYEAACGGRAARLEPATPYRDYIGWLQRQDLARAETFWREELKGIAAPTSVSDANATPDAPGARAWGEEEVRLDAAATEPLRAFAREHQLTMNTLLRGAWALLLGHYSGERDVLFGATVSGRSVELPGIEKIVGLLINTLPVRVELDPALAVRDWLRQLQEKQADIKQYEYSPLVQVQGWSAVERGTPLFESILIYENYPVDESVTEQSRQLHISNAQGYERTNYPLTVTAAAKEGLLVKINYDQNLYRPWKVRRMLKYLLGALAQFAADPAQRLGSLLRLVPDDDLRQLAVWNDTATDFPSRLCLHELIEAQVERTPDAVALVSGDERLTYAELNARANQLAERLRQLGVGPEALVGIMLPRTAELPVALLAVLKSGGAYLPLDPEYPAERLSYMVADAGVRLVLSRTDISRSLADTPVAVMCLDDAPERARLDAQSRENPSLTIRPEQLAYVLYTSGSTGRPKGVMIRHRNVVNFCAGMDRHLACDPPGTWLALTSISFDISVLELFWTLARGFRVVLHNDAAQTTPAPQAPLSVGEQITLHGVTHLQCTPSLARLLSLNESDFGALRQLRQMLVGGEELPRNLAAQLREVLEGQLLNMYGPTETTIWSTTDLVTLDGGGVSIGRPIANTQIHLLDADQHRVPVGVAGELYIGGAGLARGYWRRPDLTAERFIPDAFSGEAGARLYRTGDIARYLPDGRIEYLGRADQQIKLSGHRIELGEIEAILQQAAGVREAVVAVQPDERGEPQLTAYVVGTETTPPGGAEAAALAETSTGPDAATLRSWLATRLPTYMLPRHVVLLAELPLTANGKVDRRRLPAPALSAGEEGGTSAPARTATEELVAGLFADVLKVERVGREQSFFELGGHSLLATQVVSRVRALFGVEIPLRTLFERPTVAGFAAAVDEAVRAAEGLAAPPLVRRAAGAGEGEAGVGVGRPLSYAQQRMWFLDQLEPGSSSYNIPAAVRLRGALDAGALGGALTEVVRRHEALRTSFRMVDTRPVQVVGEAEEMPLPLLDLSGLGVRERDEQVRRLAAEEAARPFDLSRGPLLRATLLRLGEDEQVLLVTMHHVVSDGWSMGVLVREVAALYEAYARGEESPLAELSIQYADYAVWQRGWLQGEVLERQLGYWREQLAGAPAVSELPTDRPRAAVQTYRGATHGFTLDAGLTASLRELSRREGATLFMTMLAAFKTLLHHYSGAEDLVVGSPVAGRTHKETEGLIGFFVNTLVLRTQLDGDPTFRELLGRVREVALGAYAHQDVPFEKLVEELQPERSLSYTPLFQVMFVLEHAQPEEGATSGGLRLEPVETGVETTKFDLTLAAGESEQGLRLNLQYNVELFEAATIQRLLAHFARVLESVALDAGQRLSQIRLLTPAEERQQLVEWNGPRVDYPRDTPIHRLFEHLAESCPHAPAVLRGSDSLSYSELNARANRLARFLLDGPPLPAEPAVALLLDRSPETVVALLAVLKLGGHYLPLDPALPASRRDFMLADAGAALVLTTSGRAAELPDGAGYRVVCLDEVCEETARQSADDLQPEVSAEGLAYINYTSGSTGRPKGVGVPHRAVVRLVRPGGYAGLGAGTRALHLAPLSFDASTFELWGPLLNGGCCVLFEGGRVPSAAELGEGLRRGRVNTLWLTAGLFNALVDEDVEALTPVAELLVGGEALSAAHVRRAQEALPHTTLINGYGPTEATTFSCTQRIERVGPEASGIPIGRGVENTRVYVLGAEMELLPAGAVGELYVGGDGLARGYVNDPAMTAERFVPDPFSLEAGGRLYRTGDLVRYDSQGRLEFVGRADNQVKVRGFRVEPGEIEAALREAAGVAEAAVVAHADVAGLKRLVAYVVAEEGAELTTGELRERLRVRLPEYMVPARIVTLDALPLTANGKIDRKALPAPDGSQSTSEQPFVAPRTPAEELLANIWSDVLGLARVGVHDNFFELGGHSLLATQVVSRLRQTLAVEVPLRALFEAPTVEGLASQVAQLQGTAQPQAPPLVPVSRDAQLPLSFAQQRLWFLDQLEPGSASYSIPAAVRLRGALDAEAIGRALSEVLRRHESLRTRFEVVGGEAAQVVQPAAAVSLPVIDLSVLATEGEREGEVRRLTSEEARQPFDLSGGSVLRTTLLKLSADEHVLLLTMHHIVTDGWSLGVLIREVAALYEAYLKGEESPLEELPIQYADYAVWQREWLQGEVLERQLGYWREQLAGAPAVLELPTDRPRPTVQSYRGAAQGFSLDGELTAALRELSRREGVTLFMLLLAAFKVLLSRSSGQEDVVVGSPVAGRNRAETEGLIGFFVNTLVLRTDLSGDPTFGELLRRVREVALGAYAHQEVPFEKLVEELQPDRDLSRQPLFDVLFNNVNVPMETLTLPELTLSPLGQGDAEDAITEPHAKFAITVYVEEAETEVRLRLLYQVDLFSAERIAVMVEQFKYLLEQIAQDPSEEIQAYSLVTETARRLLPDPGAALPEPEYQPVPDIFAALAAREPHRVALRQGGSSLTYGELYERASSVARALAAENLERGDVVAVLGPRSFGLITGLMGVLMSGGVLLTIDPALPAQRQQLMLAEAGARRLLYVGEPRPEDGWLEVQAGLRVTRLDDEGRVSAGASDTQTPSARGVCVGPEDAAYIFFTSGSTGAPKGVLGRHKGLSHFLAWQRETFAVGPDDRCAQLTNLSFDVVLRDIFLPLTSGAALCLPDELFEVTAAETLRWLEREHITLLHTVPSLAQTWLAQPTAGVSLARLRLLFFAGEPLTDALVRRWREAFPRGGELINLYGPTETTLAKCWYRVPDSDVPTGVQPVGRPLPSTQALVLSEDGRLCGIGERGEIVIRTPFRTLGYINAPAHEQRFVVNPFGGGGPQDLLYRTGDRGRYRPDGLLEILGRIDQQIKVHGVRVEPGEIESVLNKHPAVRASAVTAWADGDEKRLAAYVVFRAGETASGAELRNFLRRDLPQYMTPASFHVLAELPLLPNGKINRQALPAPGDAPPASEAVFVAPRNAVEEVVAGIWCEVLRLERVGVEDNFFDLGGHSLLATQVIEQVRETFRVALPLRRLFESPTVADLAALMLESPDGGARVEKTAALVLSLARMSDEEIDERLGENSPLATGD